MRTKRNSGSRIGLSLLLMRRRLTVKCRTRRTSLSFMVSRHPKHKQAAQPKTFRLRHRWIGSIADFLRDLSKHALFSWILSSILRSAQYILKVLPAERRL